MRHVIAFSGGKDSSAMAAHMIELHPEINFEYIYTPTGDELPEMKAHIKHMEKILGGPINTIAQKTLSELVVEMNMLPNFRARWCTRILKIEPFIEYMEGLENGSIMYVGLRADETGRLGLVPPNAKFEVQFPMQDWGWQLPDVLRYLECHDIHVPKRTDCARCFYQTLPEWYSLWENYPGIYQDAVEEENRIGHTYRSPGRDTWPAALEELALDFAGGRIPKPRKRKDKDPSKCRFCTM